MRNLQLVLLLVSAGLVVGAGCGDDTGTGGGGGDDAPGGQGTGAGTNNGGNGGNGGEATGGGGGTGGTGGVGGMGPGYSCEAAAAAPPQLTLVEVTSGLVGMVQAKSPPGAPDRLFIVQQDGFIRIFENGALVPGNFLDVSDLIRGGLNSEEGLLGLAFHPDYADNGRFFIHYSADGNGASTVVEYAVSADPLVADPTPVQLVFQHGTDESNHNGGAVEFGNDGFLYISLGDGGAQTDPGCDALNLGTMLGKLVRVDVDGTPDGNGYPAAAGNPDGAKYYHIGFRNPWRITFDGCTGDLYIGDVGQGSREEIDVAQQADGPLNFGWPVREGTIAQPGYDGSCTDEPANPVEPIADYSHAGGACSVTGGYVYRGSETPNLRGWYFFADYCSGAISMMRSEDGGVAEAAVDSGLNGGNVSAFGQDGNGEVYVCDLGGTLYQIAAQ